jgi:hypothetical protein
MSKTEQIIELRRAHPTWTLAKIGREAGVTRQAAQRALKQAGLPTRADPLMTRFHPSQERENLVNRFGAHRVTTHAAGAVGELQVACDMLRRGLNVYKAMHTHSECDLIALIDRKCIRIEVRSGRQTKDGKISVARPLVSDRVKYDVLAIAFPDGEIVYEPPFGEW